MANPELGNSEFIPDIKPGNITREDGRNYVKEILETHPDEFEQKIDIDMKDVEKKSVH